MWKNRILSDHMYRSIINTVQTEEEAFLGTVSEGDTNRPWMFELKLNKHSILFKIDTGADITIISQNVYCKERDGSLRCATTQLSGPGKTPLAVLGCFSANLKKKDSTCKDRSDLRREESTNSTCGKACN